MNAPPAALCILPPVADATGVDGSLVNINTTILPDGACCYAIAENLVYRLHKGLTASSSSSSGLLPQSGPGVWVPEGGSAMFVVSVTASPGSITANDSEDQVGLVPTGTLLATDQLFGPSLGVLADVPSGILVTPRIDLLTVLGEVRVALDFVNATTGDKVVADNLHYYIIVYRPVPA